MDKVRDLVSNLITEYNKSRLGVTSLLEEIHANIDIDSINYNLVTNKNRQLSLAACDTLSSKDFSYIVRRQLLLTDAQRTQPSLTTDEVESIIEFIGDPSLDSIPPALNRFSKYERWENGYDESAKNLIKRLKGRNSTFTFAGTSYPPVKIDKNAIIEAAKPLIGQML